jgi:lysophospholipase
MALRAGSHLVVVGSNHELLMEQDRYRTQFWAAFDAFVPGTPLF